MGSAPEFVYPDWPAPRHVRAVATTRIGGVSKGSYAEFNLSANVGDSIEEVRQNRDLLVRALRLPGEPYWMEQQHGGGVREAQLQPEGAAVDASCTARAGPVCVVQTADCLPVLLCSRKGDWVAAAHAGWRGIAAGVLQAAVAAYPGSPKDLMAWFGPAISAECYEVDAPVRDAFTAPLVAAALRPSGRDGHWHLSLTAAAAWQLEQVGVSDRFGGDLCTYKDARRFYSHRRGSPTGRMATLIWMEKIGPGG